MIVSKAHLRRVLKEYVAYFNRSRPHQGIDQHVPDPENTLAGNAGKAISFPVLGALGIVTVTSELEGGTCVRQIVEKNCASGPFLHVYAAF